MPWRKADRSSTSIQFTKVEHRAISSMVRLILIKTPAGIAYKVSGSFLAGRNIGDYLNGGLKSRPATTKFYLKLFSNIAGDPVHFDLRIPIMKDAKRSFFLFHFFKGIKKGV